MELEIDERTTVQHLDERFNYFYDWSQEMSHNDTHLVPVVLSGDLPIATWKVILIPSAQYLCNQQSYTDTYNENSWFSYKGPLIW